MSELKIRIKKDSIKNIFKILNWNLIILFLFVFASISYINIDKLIVTHPGNIKASDPFGHTIIAQDIIDTGQWNYIGPVFSLGRDTEVNPQPPLYYLNSAILTLFSGLPTWITMYFLVCISQAFFVIMVYLITKEIFNNEKTSFIASFLSIFPLPISTWLYPMYIGMWIQVPAYFFLMAGIWLFIRYMNRKENWTLFFLGVSISSLVLIHPTDIMLLFIPTLIIAIDALLQFLKDKNVFELIKKGFLISILPLISIFAMLPRFLIVWRWHSGSGYTPGYYGLNNFFNVVKDNPVLQRVLPPISQIPNIELILFVLSLILLTFAIFLPYQFYVKNNKNIAGKKVNPKSKTIWLLFTIYYFAFIYLAEVFLYQPYYIGRMRNLQPYIIFPTLAFLLYNIIQGISLLIQLSIKDKGEFIKNSFSLIATLLLIIFLFYGTGMKLQYDQLVHGMQNQHLTIQEYEAYKWFHKNALPDETILFFGGISQNEQLYANRIHAVIDMNEYQRLLNGFAINETITLLNLQGWGGSTTRTNIQRYSRWDYEELPEPSNNVSINEFNYVFFQDLSEQVAQANDYIIYNYVQELGFKLVYDNNGYTIIKNDNK